jgi:hypothetical protein
MDPIQRLEHDHRTVEAVFEEYLEHAHGQSDKANEIRGRLAARAREELLAHAATVEEILYPELRKASARGRALAEAAHTENEKVKALLADIAKTPVDHPLFDAKVNALMEGFGRHVQAGRRRSSRSFAAPSRGMMNRREAMLNSAIRSRSFALPLLIGGVLGFVAVFTTLRRRSIEAVPGWGGPDTSSPRRNAGPDAGLSQM